jgi:hypothetical protein
LDQNPVLGKKTKSYNWIEYHLKTDKEKQSKLLGLNAEEAAEVSPAVVTRTPDLDKSGKETGESTLSVKYSVVGMQYFVAFQEAQGRIEKLERRLKKLEKNNLTTK